MCCWWVEACEDGMCGCCLYVCGYVLCRYMTLVRAVWIYDEYVVCGYMTLVRGVCGCCLYVCGYVLCGYMTLVRAVWMYDISMLFVDI